MMVIMMLFMSVPLILIWFLVIYTSNPLNALFAILVAKIGLIFLGLWIVVNSYFVQMARSQVIKLDKEAFLDP